MIFDALTQCRMDRISSSVSPVKKGQFHRTCLLYTSSDAKSELSPWDSRLQVSSRGYMLGYNDLKDPSVSGFFRFLAKVGDNGMKMQIVKIGFGDRQ